MTDGPRGDTSRARWRLADLSSALLAVNPHSLGGVRVRAGHGPVRGIWEDRFRQRLGADRPVRTLSSGVPEERLIGGLDISATLAGEAPVLARGLLADADRGALRVPMAEGLGLEVAGPLSAALDRGEVRIERGGMSAVSPARFGLVLLDEGGLDDPQPPERLLDRMAFEVNLHGVTMKEADWEGISPAHIEEARLLAADVHVPDEVLRALDAAALSLGVVSLRAVGFAMMVTRSLAALESRTGALDADAALAAQLCFAHRALHLPPVDDEDDGPQESPPPSDGQDTENEPLSDGTDTLEDQLIAAVRTAVELGLTAPVRRTRKPLAGQGGTGKTGAERLSYRRGRPLSARPGDPRSGARLDLQATLRAAAPWQALRRGETAQADRSARVALRPEDFRIQRFRQRAESVVIFLVDASGSAAVSRMAEAKGAVEHLLSGCYSRRDHVALIAFQRATADCLLPPTRSLARVKRSLAALPGGGGTPLAAGLAEAIRMVDSETRRGRTPFLVILSDGRGNVALDGHARRDEAEMEANLLAERIATMGVASVVFDTGRRPGPRAAALAEAMGGTYRPLPAQGGEALAGAVRRLMSEA